MESFPGHRHHESSQEAAERQETGEQPEFHYEILRDPEMRMRYVHLTDELIRKTQADEIDHMVFLDKSARPVEWMMRELWPTLAEKDEDGNTPPMPDVSFLNIDREQWEPIVGRSEDASGLNVDNIPEKEIENLRKVFRGGEGESSVLEDKKVLIVDEVMVSGDTSRIASGVMNRAFGQEAEIESAHWMIPQIKTDKSGNRRNAELPAWYSDTSSTGRGVADRDSSKSRQSSSRVQRDGALWLSTRFREGPDERGKQLREEMKTVAQEIEQGELPYFPSPQRGKKEFAQRVRDFNGVEPREFAQMRQEAKEKRTTTAELLRKQRAAKAGKSAVKAYRDNVN